MLVLYHSKCISAYFFKYFWKQSLISCIFLDFNGKTVAFFTKYVDISKNIFVAFINF